MDNELLVLGENGEEAAPVPDASQDSQPASDDEVLDALAASETDVSFEFPSSMEVSNLWERPILTTPLNDYTVTEGLLLLIFLVLAVRSLFRLWNN